MLENILTQRGLSFRLKLSIKSIISVALIVLAVGLPQIFHIFLGASGGITYLPMYLPALLAGCILGKWWGLGVGVLSPIASFAFTSLALGSAMPALARLPFMVVELGVFGLVSGLFSKKITENMWLAFPAVLLAEVAGRAAFISLVAIFQTVSPLSPVMVWSQIQSGLMGLVMWAVVAPAVVMLLTWLLRKDREND